MLAHHGSQVDTEQIALQLPGDSFRRRCNALNPNGKMNRIC
jgi:hypothetical protein